MPIGQIPYISATLPLRLTKRFELILFMLLLFLLLAGRVLVYFHLNLEFVDQDQALMWMAAKDFLGGHVNEPRFYGQNYNTMLEGLFAVPLMKLGMKVYHAVPLVTHIFFLFPYLFAALYLYNNQKKYAAMLMLSIPLCLPTEFDMVSGIPRGFVTGLFFCSLFIVSWHKPSNMRWLHVNAALATVAYFVNPGSLLLSVPLAVYLLILNCREKKFYSVFITISISYLLMYFLFDHYYVQHPQSITVPLKLVFSWEELLLSLQHLDAKLVHLSFFAPAKSFTLFLFLVPIMFLAFYQKPPVFFAACSLLFFLLLTFTFRKNIEGTTWPFYSFSRNYLGLPMAIGIMGTLVRPQNVNTRWFLLIPLLFSIYKLPNTQPNIKKYIDKDQNFYITVFKLDFVKEAIEVYKNYCKNENIHDLLVSKRFWLSSVLVYGGPAIDPEFPSAIEVEHDRRRWLMDAYEMRQLKQFAFLSPLSNFDNEVFNADSAFSIRRLDQFGLFAVSNNKLKTSEFLKRVQDTEFPDHP